MLNRLMGSSRALLLLSSVLLMIIAVLLAVLLQQDNQAATPAVPLASATFGLPTSTIFVPPTTTPTPVVVVAVALRNIPAHTQFGSPATAITYFGNSNPKPGTPVPGDAIPGISLVGLAALNGLTNISPIETTHAISKGTILQASALRILPYSPLSSLAYDIQPGRVALSIPVLPSTANNGHILPGDMVNVLLTIHQLALNPYVSNPPKDIVGPIETQQLIANVRVLVANPLANLYTLELPLQDALLMKYVRDSAEGTVDLALRSAADVRVLQPVPLTNPVVPDYFLTPIAVVPGSLAAALPTPVPGVPNPFSPQQATPTPPLPPSSQPPPPISVQVVNPFQGAATPVATEKVINPILNP